LETDQAIGVPHAVVTKRFQVIKVQHTKKMF